jgi:hypothetical protein
VACRHGGEVQEKQWRANKAVNCNYSTDRKIRYWKCRQILSKSVSFKNTRILSVAHNETRVEYWNSKCPRSKTILNSYNYEYAS